MLLNHLRSFLVFSWMFDWEAVFPLFTVDCGLMSKHLHWHSKSSPVWGRGFHTSPLSGGLPGGIPIEVIITKSFDQILVWWLCEFSPVNTHMHGTLTERNQPHPWIRYMLDQHNTAPWRPLAFTHLLSLFSGISSARTVTCLNKYWNDSCAQQSIGREKWIPSASKHLLSMSCRVIVGHDWSKPSMYGLWTLGSITLGQPHGCYCWDSYCALLMIPWPVLCAMLRPAEISSFFQSTNLHNQLISHKQ